MQFSCPFLNSFNWASLICLQYILHLFILMPSLEHFYIPVPLYVHNHLSEMLIYRASKRPVMAPKNSTSCPTQCLFIGIKMLISKISNYVLADIFTDFCIFDFSGIFLIMIDRILFKQGT